MSDVHQLFADQLASAKHPHGHVDLDRLADLVSAAYEEADGSRCRNDHTDERRAEELARLNADLERLVAEAKKRNLLFETALENMAQGLCFFDGAQTLIVCNRRYAEMYGLSPEDVRPGITLREIAERRLAVGSFPYMSLLDYFAQCEATVLANKPKDSIVELRNGRVFAIRHQPMPDSGWVATHEDITERRQAEARIAHMASHDALTGLPNRVLLRERLEDALTRAGRGESCAVLCLDLDRFKNVNDTLGHPVGDALLRAITARMQTHVRQTDTVARLGGDEFAIVQRGLSQPLDATSLAERLVQELGEAYELDGHQLVIGVSIGIAIAPGDGTEPDQLLKNADIALYSAKAAGRGCYRFFEPKMDMLMQARRALELDLRRAVRGGEFELFYQPFVNLRSGQVSGFEALLRWRHPDRGLVSPDQFIPLAEEIGLIAPIGEWVLHQACREAATWPDRLKVSVNLSAVQFKGETLVGAVASALRTSGLRPTRLELEITESVMMEVSESALSQLHQLRGLGISISMDDFGTGYSSLSYLRSFPFDKVKIDQSFIREIGHKPDCMAIVRAIIGLCGHIGMATTAEGVETEEQLAALTAERCMEVQGYLFSRPRPAKDIPLLLRKDAQQALAVEA